MKKIVVLTGAGMSAESGFSTFRDAGGLWEEYPVEQVATPEGFSRNPKLVVEFYNRLRRQLFAARPNKGHELLAALEQDYEVVVITQNVDNLHERAGSSRVIHLHGELDKVTSSRCPNNPEQIRRLTESDADPLPTDVAPDGSLLRPFIVWFGEAVPLIEVAAEQVEQADVFVVIGTSLNVYPAAGLLHYVAPGTPVFLIDPKPVQWHSAHEFTQFRMGASAGVEELTSALKKLNL